jgi:hypothetical protein
MKKVHINWDALGIGASLACAIHCALLPLVLTSLPVFGFNIIHNLAFEIGMIGLALSIGLISLYHGYHRHHHRVLPVIIFLSGFVFLVLKQFFVKFENWLLVPAVILIVSAHFFNYRFCRVHNHAHKEDCNH